MKSRKERTKVGQPRVNVRLTLAEKVSKQLDRWMAEDKSPASKVAWVDSYEGKVYIRYNSYMDKIDLAFFEIKERFRQKGVAKSVIEVAATKNVKTVRIENVSVPAWLRKVVTYQLENRIVATKGELPKADARLCCVTVDFVRK